MRRGRIRLLSNPPATAGAHSLRSFPSQERPASADVLSSVISRKYSDVSSGLWIFLLEAGAALAILVFIVWWTLPAKPKSGDRARERPSQNGSSGRH